jgi:hypothetical protein
LARAVRLIVEKWGDVRADYDEACAELDRLCEEFPIKSLGRRLSRDELYDRP